MRLFYDQVFVKEPNTVERTDWHHDLPFWPLRGNDVASVWVALTEVGPENSQLETIVGSHKWGKFYAAAVPDKDAHCQRLAARERIKQIAQKKSA